MEQIESTLTENTDTQHIKRIYGRLSQLQLVIMMDIVLFSVTSAASFFPDHDLTLFVFVLGSYALLAPVLAYPNVRHRYVYLFVYPGSYFGSWFGSTVSLMAFSIPFLEASVLASMLSIILVTSIHVFSSMRNIIRSSSMASAGRGLIVIASLFFLAVILALSLTQTGSNLSSISKAMLYTAFLVAYVLSSMLFVNSSYRLLVLCSRLGIRSVRREYSELWKQLAGIYSDARYTEQLDLLDEYFSEAISEFEEGYYELSFLSGYRVINEETVVQPRCFINDNRESEPSFSQVRTRLVHSRSHRDPRLDPRLIRDTRRELPKLCIELIHRCFALIRILTVIGTAVSEPEKEFCSKSCRRCERGQVD